MTLTTNHPQQPTSRSSTATLTAMRARSSITWPWKAVLVTGPGVLVGAALSGIIALLTGHVALNGGLFVIAVLGAGFGAGIGTLTRSWLVPAAPRRTLAFTGTGALILPLVACAGQAPHLGGLTVALALLGGIATLALYLHARSRTATRTR